MLLVTLHINVYQTASNMAQVNLLDENNHLGIPMMIFLPFSFSPPMASILTQMYFPEKKKKCPEEIGYSTVSFCWKQYKRLNNTFYVFYKL